MQQYDKIYVDGIRKITMEGIHKADRTSVGGNTSIFGHSFHFSMTDGESDNIYVPFLQCRTFAPRIAFEELMWMLRGQTDAKILQDKNIHIWDGNTSREFLDSRGLHDTPVGSIGKGYGHQFRNFNGVDQLQLIFDNIKNNPTDRRHLISLWNPSEINEMALPPCHMTYTFMVQGEYLNLHQSMRSSDFLYGNPYNSAFTALWLALFSKALGYKAGAIYYTGTDVHLYDNQLEVAEELLRVPSEDLDKFSIPQIKINKEINTLEDVLNVQWEDIEVIDWKRGPKIGNAKMAV